MIIRVICGSGECRKEFSADTEDSEWVCPDCSRVIKNPHYPFLTARIMHSRYKPEEVDWEYLFNKLLEDVHNYFDRRMAFLFETEGGARARREMGDEEVRFVREMAAGGPDLLQKLQERFDSDWQKMHDSLLKEATDIAWKIRAFEQPKDEPDAQAGSEAS